MNDLHRERTKENHNFNLVHDLTFFVCFNVAVMESWTFLCDLLAN